MTSVAVTQQPVSYTHLNTELPVRRVVGIYKITMRTFIHSLGILKREILLYWMTSAEELNDLRCYTVREQLNSFPLNGRVKNHKIKDKNLILKFFCLLYTSRCV